MYLLTFTFNASSPTEIIQISHMELIHSSHIIHCDVKPANFLMGTGLRNKQVYITDFGLSKLYRDPKTHVHIGRGGDPDDVLTGTAIYVSLNNHQGIKQTHHDNLESLAYMLIYFLCGSLPWSRAKTSTKRECRMIMQRKLNLLPNFLGGFLGASWVLVILLFSAIGTNPFVYFQF